MSNVIEFKGFADALLTGESGGSPADPAVLLLHGGGHTREAWSVISNALIKAGRQVFNIDLRGPEVEVRSVDKNSRYELDICVQNLRRVLDQLPTRPVIVASAVGGWIASVAIGETSTPLASGLVVVDVPPNMDLDCTAGDPVQDWDPNHLKVLNVSVDTMRPRLVAAAENIKVPTLFIHTCGKSVSDTAAREFASSIRDAEFVEIDAKACSPSDRLDLFNATLLDFLERKNPRMHPEYIAGSDARTLRDAMGCFATGITVLTAIAPDGKPIGLTANSFTSVSLDPPLVLACIARSAKSIAVLENAENFAINVLHIGQQPTSNLFASKVEDRFAQVEWEMGRHGTPVIRHSLATVECRRHAIHDGGDHIILIGKVERAAFDPRRDPLLYFAGKYRRLHLG